MSADLHTQLAEYGRNQRAERRPVELTDIQAVANTAGVVDEPSAQSHETTQFDPDEGDVIMFDIETRESGEAQADETNRRRWAGRAILAAAAVIVVIVAVTLFDDTDESLPIDVVDAPLDADALEPIVLSPGEAALAISDDYIEAVNSGDADAVLALLAHDVAFLEKYTAMSPGFEEIGRASFEQRLAWNTAQGTTFTSPECAVTDSGEESVEVLCEFGWLDAAERAAGAPAVPTVLDLVVTAGGISQLEFEYPPDFGLAGFDSWLSVNHSEDSQGVEFGDWSSLAEARAGGALRAQYAAEWAAGLEAND